MLITHPEEGTALLVSPLSGVFPNPPTLPAMELTLSKQIGPEFPAEVKCRAWTLLNTVPQEAEVRCGDSEVTQTWTSFHPHWLAMLEVNPLSAFIPASCSNPAAEPNPHLSGFSKAQDQN